MWLFRTPQFVNVTQIASSVTPAQVKLLMQLLALPEKFAKTSQTGESLRVTGCDSWVGWRRGKSHKVLA